MKTLLCTLLVAGAAATAQNQANAQATASYDIIPLPSSVAVDPSAPGFALGSNVSVSAPPELAGEAAFLSEYLSALPAVAAPGTVTLEIAGDGNPEGYTISAAPVGVRVSAPSAGGVFYGVQTLRKAAATAPDGQAPVLPAGTVKDQPRYAYRGAHFDVSRHFYNTGDVKKFIDMMALHNLNTMHWHLNDDQGWRIEIKKYPRLVDVGSRRDSTIEGHNQGPWNYTPEGGFYTQEQAREIVDYAAKRHINVIPEIDLPGHMLGALAAYPEMGCTGGPYGVWGLWGVSDDVLCAGNDKSMEFVTDVLGEIMDVFPSPIIHIGGDECPKTRWEQCPKCQARIKAEGIKGNDKYSAEQELQAWVTRQAVKAVTDRGRTAMGWDEILEGDIPVSAIIHSWRGMEGAKDGADRGHRVVASPVGYMYFDYYQTRDTEKEPLAIGGYLPLEKVYSFDPAEGLTPQQASMIMGPQANLWTEYVTTYPHVEYMELPRMAALAEVAWTDPSQKDYAGFSRRLPSLLRLYDKAHYHYRDPRKPQ